MAAGSGDVNRLSLRTLDTVPAPLRPPIDPRGLSVGIVHLGIGAFHRAHQAAFTEDAIVAAGGDWGSAESPQRSPPSSTSSRLRTACTRWPSAAPTASACGSSASCASCASRGLIPGGLLERIADPAVHVITLNVSEKGYRHDATTGRLRLHDPGIAADLNGSGPLNRGRAAGARARRAPPPRTAPRSPSSAATSCPTTEGAGGADAVTSCSPQRRPVSCCHGSRPGPLPVDDGRPDHPGDDRVRPRLTSPPTRPRGPRGGDHRAVPPVGHRGRLRRSEACLGARRRDHDRRRATLRASQDPAAERLPLDGRLPRGAGRPGVRERRASVRGCRSSAVLRDADGATTLRRPCSVPAGFDLAAYETQVLESLRQRRAALPDAADRRWTAARSCPAAARHRARQAPGRRAAGVAALGVAAWMRDIVSARRSDGGRSSPIDDPLADPIAERLGDREDPAAVADASCRCARSSTMNWRGDTGLRELLVELPGRLASDGACGPRSI